MNESTIDIDFKSIIKRKSKNDPEGRSNKCEYCGKAYLSIPAMSQHIKSKHRDRLKGNRGRGRPSKKEQTKKEIREIFIKSFFDKEERRKDNKEEKLNVENTKAEAINELRVKYPNILIYISSSNNNSDNHKDKDKEIDQLIDEYLLDIKNKTNGSYLLFACKFLYLLKNFILQENISSKEEFPDHSNDFLAEFMDKNGFFSLDNKEIIDILRHFFNWMYDKKYTISVLNISSNN